MQKKRNNLLFKTAMHLRKENNKETYRTLVLLRRTGLRGPESQQY